MNYLVPLWLCLLIWIVCTPLIVGLVITDVRAEHDFRETKKKLEEWKR